MRDMTMDSTHFFVSGLVQTFIDNVVIEGVQDITRRWHNPARRDGGPLIAKDRPWEHLTYFSGSDYTVLRDPEDGLFKCWYEEFEPRPEMVAGVTMGWVLSRQLYAESEDGIHWRKPELDVYEEDGRKTNIVLGGESRDVHALAVAIDPHAATKEEMFRALYMHLIDDEKGSKIGRIECAHSPDGIHWKAYDELPSMGMSGPHLDDVSVIVYDEYSREFVQNTRHFMMGAAGALNLRNPYTASMFRPYEPNSFGANNKRRIFQSRSHDFIHWSEPVLVAATDDEEDNLDESFYCMPQFKVGNVHLATVGVFRGVDNEMDVQLLKSRDGVRFDRTNKRQPFLAPRGEGHWDAHMVSMVSPPIEVGDELWFYHGGTNYHHDWFMWDLADNIDHPDVRDPLGGIWGLGLATLRRDGYAGLFANRYREGIVVTQPLFSQGAKLVINARCEPGGGSVLVEVADRYYDVIEQCSKADCDAFTGDNVAHTVTWKHDARVPAGPEEMRNWRKLRFFLRDAELFSFRFTDPEE